MQDELSILALYGLFVCALYLLHVVSAGRQLGFRYMASPRDEPRRLTGIPGRIRRSLDNSLVALAMVAPPILVLGLRDGYSGTTTLAAQLFLVCRLLYVPVYIAGVPYLRTALFVLGFLATTWLCLVAFVATP